MSPRIRLCVYITLALIPLTSGAAYADEATFSATGSTRNFIAVVDDRVAALSLLRLKAFLYRGAFTGEFAYELSPRYLKNGDGISLYVVAAPVYRAFDFKEALYDEAEFSVTQNLDRVLVTLATAHADILAGRQPVAFGSARTVNPTDVVAPFAYSTIATEERPGVDALRVRVPVSKMGELDAGVVAGRDFKASRSAVFIRSKSYVLKTDVSIMAMTFRENLLFGIDFARSIGGAGTWLEAACAVPEEGSGDGDYTRLSAGADYSFTGKLYAYMEYHFNGAGADKTGNYSNVISKTPYIEGAVYLLGRHYMAPGLTYEVTPLVALNAGAIVNLNDGSALLSPALSVSLADDVTLKFGAFPAVGGKAGSEFGRYPDIMFAAFNVYF